MKPSGKRNKGETSTKPKQPTNSPNILSQFEILAEAKEGDEKQNNRLIHVWLGQSVMGIVGTILNSSVLYIFYSERQSLLTSVNAMTRWSN